VPRGPRHNVRQRVGAGTPAVHDRQHEMVAVTHLPARDDHVGVADRALDGPELEAVRHQAFGIDGQRVFPDLRTVELDPVHTGNRAELRDRLVDDEVGEFRERALAGRDRHADDGEGRGVEQPRLHPAIGGETRPHLLHRRLDELERPQHVALPTEREVDLGPTASRLRADDLHAEHAREDVLEWLRDRSQGLLDG